MKRTLAAVAATVSLSLGALISPAPAHADEASFINDLVGYGVVANNGTISSLLWWGYAVCGDGRIGRTTQQSTDNIYYYPNNNLTYAQAREVVMAAYTFLC